MAETFLLSAARLNQIGDVGDSSLLVLDAILSETHLFENEVTKHPVEVGSNITDHARTKPRMFTLEGIVTDTPIGASLARSRQNDADIGTSTEGSGNSFAAFRQLEKLSTNHTLLTVITAFKIYNDMMIESITVTRDANTGRALRFSATLSQIVFVSTKLTDNVKAKTHRAQKKSKTGKQPTALKLYPLPDAPGFFTTRRPS